MRKKDLTYFCKVIFFLVSSEWLTGESVRRKHKVDLLWLVDDYPILNMLSSEIYNVGIDCQVEGVCMFCDLLELSAAYKRSISLVWRYVCTVQVQVW